EAPPRAELLAGVESLGELIVEPRLVTVVDAVPVAIPAAMCAQDEVVAALVHEQLPCTGVEWILIVEPHHLTALGLVSIAEHERGQVGLIATFGHRRWRDAGVAIRRPTEATFDPALARGAGEDPLPDRLDLPPR